MENHAAVAASPWVVRHFSLIAPQGEVLDLACGQGRHARLLAAHGYTVEAVDVDASAIASLQGIPGIHAHCADLESAPWPYAGRQFAGIVVTNYLWRPLFPTLLAALAPGGVLIYETFMVGNESFGKPSNPAFLLQPDELRNVAQCTLNVIAFEQGEVAEPRPAVVQRMCAVRPIP